MDQPMNTFDKEFNRDFKFLRIFSEASGIILAVLAIYILYRVLGLLFSL